MPIDYKRYPSNWKSEIVPSILNRANDRCECCGLQNGWTVWSVKFSIKDEGRYKDRSIWFRIKDDALREAKRPELVREVTVVLTIAHLDHDEENHDVKLNRLKAMCQLCHLRYDAKEKYLRSLKNWSK